MPISHDLTQLDPNSFENMVNYLAMKVLGQGSTSFGPGADGGRDGYFEGEAAYPSSRTKWSGRWYIQSKFHRPHLSANAQKWLISQVRTEIAAFKQAKSTRILPDIWIIATNIEPSGMSGTGAYDTLKKIVRSEFGEDMKFDIWGGQKILHFLSEHPSVASYYGHFLTPGSVLTSLYDQISDENTQIRSVIEHLVVGQFNEQIYTKLEQAGSSSDNRPKLYELFVDLPFLWHDRTSSIGVLAALVVSSATCHKVSAWNPEGGQWREWLRNPKRARIVVLKGGPGQGKSTIGQYFSQIQRAALILAKDGPSVTSTTRYLAEQFKLSAEKQEFWSESPRIPVTIELKDFAAWYGIRPIGMPKGILSYLCEKISLKTEQNVLPGTMKRAFAVRSWFVNFDGLDEVPNDVKDEVAEEIIKFTDEMLPLIDADVLTVCTTRPQGYSGQFDKLEASMAVLSSLPPATALVCASAVVRFNRSDEEAQYSIDVLTSAMQSVQVLELMTSPLQSHIMAVVVRDGGRPPEKRWELFDNFYKVMKKRESQKNFQDIRISKLLREDDTLLKAIHTRLGISLHVLAENSRGAETTLEKKDFRELAYSTTSVLIDENVDDVVDALMEATTERLVFVNTPENSNSVRFDIRQLQEFFAGEFIYSEVSPEQMCVRMEAVCTDSHWREVMHFALSALVFNGRRTELSVASNVLTAADSEGDCHRERIISKRMAVGALLGIRLINEGVLEQDKRLRQIFIDVLKPLYALSDENILYLLTEKRHPNSQAWLINAMVEHLFEASEEEGIGAALALICILPDDHPRVSDVSDRIINASDSYIEVICKFFVDQVSIRGGQGEPYGVRKPKVWFSIALLKLLISTEPKFKINLRIIIEVVSNNIFQLARTDFFRSLSVSETKLLFVLTDVGFVRKDKSKIKPEYIDRYKGITPHEMTFNWREEHLPEIFDFDVSPSENIGPLLQFIFSVISFSKKRNIDSFKSIVVSAKKFGSISKILTKNLGSLLPLCSFNVDWDEQMDALSEISSEDFSKMIDFGVLGDSFVSPSLESLSIDGNYSEEGWRYICRDFPRLALDVWMRDIGNSTEFYGSPDCIKHIYDVAKKYPHMLVRYILQWGKLFSSALDGGVELRKILRCGNFKYEKEYFPLENIFAFDLDRVHEIKFLPWIAKALISRALSGEMERNNRVQKNQGQELRSFMDAFGLDEKFLRDLFINELIDTDVRQAALVIYVTGNHLSQIDYREFFQLEKNRSLIEGLLEKEPSLWFLKAIVIFCENNLSYYDTAARKMIGNCFFITRENYYAQSYMQNLLNKWRESSNAPVQTRGLLHSWLKGEA